MKNVILTTILSLFVSISIPIANAATLAEELNSLFESHPNAVWSVRVDESKSGKTIYSKTPDRNLIPASNEKIVTCGAAILDLNPEYTYETAFFTSGAQMGSVLDGDLFVVGSGDPSLGGRFYGDDIGYLMRQWAGTLKKKGIESIRGRIIGIDDAFDDAPHGLNWHPSDLIEWYAAEVSALSFNDGCVDVIVHGGSKTSQAPQITLNPPTHYVSVDSSMKTSSSRRNERGVIINRDFGSNVLKISGSIRAKGAVTTYATVPNPTLFFANVFSEILEEEGISVSGNPTDGDDAELPDRKNWRPLFVHQSPPLADLIDVCMKNSQNLYAEHFMKTLGYKEYGVGTWQTGALAIKDIFFSKGCNLDSIFIADGSGLSRENRISASALVRILKTIAKSPQAESFFRTFPKSGVSGTLKHRMRETVTRGKVFAKTGTLNGCRALSGYIHADSGKTYYFSMLGNATRAAARLTGIMDDVCAAIVTNG